MTGASKLSEKELKVTIALFNFLEDQALKEGVGIGLGIEVLPGGSVAQAAFKIKEISEPNQKSFIHSIQEYRSLLIKEQELLKSSQVNGETTTTDRPEGTTDPKSKPAK